MKTKTTVACGDWYRTWGLGTNKLGKLTKGELEGIYIWKGHQQGRHGQKYTKKYSITFKYLGENEGIEILTNESGYSLPDYRDIFEAIRILNN